MSEAERGGASTDGAGVISTQQRFDSIEVLLAALEQLQAELARLDALIDYIVERDGGSAA